MDVLRSEAVAIVRRLQEAGHQALFAGGCVRDQLLGETPKDYDIATSALPAQVTELFPHCRAVGAHFGVILVHRPDHDYEIATFRTDLSYRDGRRPEEVAFSTALEDAQRRDFTVNGIFLDPIRDEILDYVGGRDDLRGRVIRAIGEPGQRFGEDHLRLLRAVRLAAALDFTIDPATWEAIRLHAPSIRRISQERVRDEFSRMLLHPSRLRAFDLLDSSGLLDEILPEFSALRGCEQPPQFHPEGDVFVHTRLMLSLLPEKVSLPLALSVLLHDIGKPATFSVDPDGRIRFNSHDKTGADMSEVILRRLRYPNQVIAAVVEAVRNHMGFKNVQQMRASRLKRLLAAPTFEDELELHRVDCLASNGMLDNHAFLVAKQAEFAAEPLIPPPLLTGRDLIALGWKPGPAFSDILTAVQNQQLEGAFANKQAALDWVALTFGSPENG